MKMASWIKPVLISTGFVAIAMHLKVIIPAVALDVSRAPILLSSLISWLKPPYLYVLANIIIIVIGVSSRFYKSISNQDTREYETSSYSGSDYKFQNEYIVHQDPPRREETKDDYSFVATSSPSNNIVEEVERPKVVKEKVVEAPVIVKEEEEEEEKSSLAVVVAKSESLPPVDRPLVTARIGNRKLVKTTTAERNAFRALKVAKPRKNETLENTWKLITEGKPPPLTSHYRRPDTFGLVGLDETKQQGGLKKSETFKDRAKYYCSPAVSRSRDELNRRADSFIKKCNDERFESMRQDREVSRPGLSF